MVLSFLAKVFKMRKRAIEAAIMAATMIRPLSLRKVNSKNSRVKGIRKAPAMIAMVARRRAVRSLLRGREIQ